MRKAISKIILDLYEIKENPLENIDRLFLILHEAKELGLELEPPSVLLESRDKIEQNIAHLNVFSSLSNCISRFLSEEVIDYKEKGELRELALSLHSKLQERMNYFKTQLSLLRPKINDKNQEYIENLLQQCIGVILEREILPNLLEKMGYEKNTTTFNLPETVLELDGRYERKFLSGARKERLVGKNVVIVECKTTIELSDIKNYERRVKLIRKKYEVDKENWNYDKLNFEAWIVACYGWDEGLIGEATRRKLVPITPDRLTTQLRKLKIYDPRIPVCPTNE